MKIAILILAHKNPGQLRKLIDVLKTDFEVFIHFDKRFKIPSSLIEEAHVRFVQKRYAAYWGSYNTQLAILELLKSAYENNCDYYMLISGQDLPLMSNADLLKYIQSNYRDHVYHFSLPKAGWAPNGGEERVTLYWDTKYESGNRFIKPFLLPVKGTFFILRAIQKKLNIKRPVNFRLFGGSVWMNLTKEAVGFILAFVENNEWYIQRYKYTRCTDEVFFHSILSGFDYPQKDNIINDDLRYIDWQSGPEYPRVFTAKDFERCIESNKPFGRKFDETVDANIISQILEHIK